MIESPPDSIGYSTRYKKWFLYLAQNGFKAKKRSHFFDSFQDAEKQLILIRSKCK